MVPTIFSKLAARTQGGVSYKTTGNKSATGNPATAGAGAVAGRTGASSLPSSNSTSDVFQFSKTYSGVTTTAVVDSIPLTADADYIGFLFAISLTPTANTSTTADLLSCFTQWQILAGDGPIIQLLPSVDFYMLEQRWSPLHVIPTIVPLASASQVSGSYLVYGINLPQSRGPYTLQPATTVASALGTATTSFTVSITCSAIPGDASAGRTRYVYSALPFTPSANGVNDLAPVAPIQGVDLQELFISGLTSNTADISYLQLLGGGVAVTTRVTSAVLVGRAQAEMVSSLPSANGTPTNWVNGGVLFPLFALKSTLNLSRTAHAYFNWGSSPSTSIRIGMYWFD